MSNKLTDNLSNNSPMLSSAEVKKALECCAYSDGCESCPQSKQCDGVEPLVNALDLINRQEDKCKAYKHYYDECLKDLKNANAENESLKAEVERLKAEVKFSDYLEYETTNQIKAEAYKECIEKVKENIDTHEHLTCEECNCVPIGKSTLDNLLKELVGDGDG